MLSISTQPHSRTDLLHNCNSFFTDGIDSLLCTGHNSYMMEQQEVWLPVFGYNGLYEVSNNGLVRSIPTSRSGDSRFIRKTIYILKFRKHHKGYLEVKLTGVETGSAKIYKAHRVVAQAFIPNPSNLPEINHINGVKTDNRVENLEWVTTKENSLHAWETGLITNKGEGSGMSKLTNLYVIDICNRYNNKEKPKVIARTYNIAPRTVWSIATKRTWRHI